MVQRAGSFRYKTRKSLRKKPRTRGKVTVTRLLREFEVGDRVIIKQEPAIHKGMPHPRYKNRTGIVVSKRGSAYEVKVRDGNSIKKLIAAPVHLSKAK